MSITFKTAIAAAALATAGLGATTLSASESTFGYGAYINANPIMEIGLVRSSGDGVVELYDYHKGEQGRLLGSAPVKAGANQNVRINVGFAPQFDVVAVLNVNGQTEAVNEFRLR